MVFVRPVLERWPTFRDLLLEDYEEKLRSLREAKGIGRTLGTEEFVTELERRLGRPIARRAPGGGRPGRSRWGTAEFGAIGKLPPL